MSHHNVLVQLRNDSVSPIVFGTLSIGAAETVTIWDTTGGDHVSAIENFEQVLASIGLLNQYIGSKDLILVVDSSDKTINQDSFDQIHEIRKTYKTWQINNEADEYYSPMERSISGSSGTINFAKTRKWELTLTGSGTVTLNFPSGDEHYTAVLIQGGAGSFTPTFFSDGDVLFPDGVLNIKGAPGSKTLLKIYRRSNETYITAHDNMVTGSVVLT